MTLERAQRSIPIALGLLLSLAPAAHAATIISGNLFYTTFQTQGGPAGPNVYKTAFVYDSVTGLTLSGDCLIASLTGADGIIFDPSDATRKTLIVGEQKANLVASLALTLNPCLSVGVTEKRADGSASIGLGLGQAYALATPNKSTLWMMPNDPLPNQINVATLPLTADGVAHTVTGVDGIGAVSNPIITGVTFAGIQGYYGDANDKLVDGHFGTISSGFVTARVAVVDDTVGGTTDLSALGMLPTHGMTYDAYSGCIIASSANQIWQLCPGGSGGAAADGKFHVRAKIVTSCASPITGGCDSSNWDQTTTDLAGHMFAANNFGDMLFVDYSNNTYRLINGPLGGNPIYQKQQFLRADLDEVISDALPQSVPGRMTGGGSVFTKGGTRVTHGFELHCDPNNVPNALEINWDGGNNFHLTTLASAVCFLDPNLNQGQPKTGFNTYIGSGIGKLNGVAGATASWIFTDGGEPGTKDTATITIQDTNGQVLTVSGFLIKGNQQAH